MIVSKTRFINIIIPKNIDSPFSFPYGSVDVIPEFIAKEREARDEADRKFLITSLKVDRDTKMGIVSDIKQQLRRVGAFKVNYSVQQEQEEK